MWVSRRRIVAAASAAVLEQQALEHGFCSHQCQRANIVVVTLLGEEKVAMPHAIASTHPASQSTGWEIESRLEEPDLDRTSYNLEGMVLARPEVREVETAACE